MRFTVKPGSPPTSIECGTELGGALVANRAGGTVYYRSTASVSDTLFDGSLTAGQSATLYGQQFLFVAQTDANGNLNARAEVDVFVPADPAVSRFSSAQGAYVPKGSLARWEAKRAQAKGGTTLAEVVVFGDSTTYGQTSNGGSTNQANNYSYIQKLRALAIAAGYPDGGLGARGFFDTANMSAPDNLVHVSSNVGWVQGGNTNALMNYGIGMTGASAGNAITVQGKGSYTKARILYTQFSSGGGDATYSVDGGGAVAITGISASGTNNRMQAIEIPLVGSSTHTITFTVVNAGKLDFVIDWLGPSGLVFHKHGVPSIAIGGMFGPTVGWAPYLNVALGMGVNSDIGGTAPLNVPYGYPVTGPRVPALAIMNLGINDVAAATTQALAINKTQDAEAGVQLFAMMCQSAGCDGLVCLPHLQFASNGNAYSGSVRAALLETALSFNLPVLDLSTCLGTYRNAITNYAVALAAPHANAAGYDVQGQAIWDFISTVVS